MYQNYKNTSYLLPNRSNQDLYLIHHTNSNFRFIITFFIFMTILYTLIIIILYWDRSKKAVSGSEIIGKKTVLSKLVEYGYFVCLLTVAVAVLYFFYSHHLELTIFIIGLGFYSIYFTLSLTSICKAESFINSRRRIGKGMATGKLAMKNTRNAFLVISGLTTFCCALLLI